MNSSEMVREARAAYVDLIKAGEDVEREIRNKYSKIDVVEAIKLVEKIGRESAQIGGRDEKLGVTSELLCYGCVKLIEYLANIALERLENETRTNDIA